MQFPPSNQQPMGMGAPAGMAAPGPIAAANPYAPTQQRDNWQVPDIAHHHVESGTNLGASAVGGYKNAAPPVDHANLGNDDDEYARLKLPIRVLDTYPVHMGPAGTAMKCVFSVSHFLTCLAFILSIFYMPGDGGFQFYWLMCTLFFGFITVLFGLCHLDLAMMKKFLDTNPLLLNKWASLVVLSFLVLAYPYEINLNAHATRFIGSMIMFVVAAVAIVLICYGLIGLLVCPKKQGVRSYV